MTAYVLKFYCFIIYEKLSIYRVNYLSDQNFKINAIYWQYLFIINFRVKKGFATFKVVLR